MCDCMKLVGDKLHEDLMQKVPDGADVSDSIFDKTGFDNQVMSFTTGNVYVMLKYRLAYKAKKKNGDFAKNLTRLEAVVKMSYCPFCGEKQEDK